MFFFFPPVEDKDFDPIATDRRAKSDLSFYGESVWGEGVWVDPKMLPVEGAKTLKARGEQRSLGTAHADFVTGSSSKSTLREPRAAKTGRKAIRKAPGMRLFSWTKFLYSRSVVEKIFSQTINDWHIEYFEALSEGEELKTYWINISYTYTFVAAMFQKSPLGGLLEFVVKILKS